MDAKKIAQIAQIASALEVSGYPKPGNVHRTRDFDDMEFEDFIISGVVIGDSIRQACSDIDVENPQTGKYRIKFLRNFAQTSCSRLGRAAECPAARRKGGAFFKRLLPR